MSTDPDTGGRPEAEQTQSGGGGGATINIGSMSGGSLATGEHGTAQSTNITSAGLDPKHQQLLAAVSELRGRLPRQERTADDSTLDAELAEVEGEIGRDGRVDQGRLARLLGRLAAYGPAAATAASVTAVIQAIAQVLG